MIGSTVGTAYALRSGAAGAGNRSDAVIAPKVSTQDAHNRATAIHYQRERYKAQLITSIKQAVAGMVLDNGESAKMKNSNYLSHKLNHDYTYLANLFSEVTGSTINQYIIEFRIDRVKELLLAGELNLTQISYQLSYSSVAHLSNQFRKVTGLTPSLFKILHSKPGIMPESVNGVNVFCNYVNAPEVRRVSFAT